MDSTRSKRKSFTKAKRVLSFYRANKPSKLSPSNSSPTSPLEFAAAQTKNKPNKPPSPSPARGPPKGIIIVNQDQSFPQQTPRVAIVVQERSDSCAKLQNFYGVASSTDECVNAKAARYISSVQQRFHLEEIEA